MYALMLQGEGEMAGKGRRGPHAFQIGLTAMPLLLQGVTSTTNTTLDRERLDSSHVIRRGQPTIADFVAHLPCQNDYLA
ncbi:hypothetical protein Q671_16630 [Halomonas sp. PBN3]|nr:hypothetical protein Q671_16630 [Halomonas sp. PBN3]